VATVVVALDHVPPPLVLLNETVKPWQRVDAPEIAAGTASTVTVLVAVHPPARL